MRLAILGDIHGNKEALKAVLLDINQRQVDCAVSTGDLVGYMQYPNEVIDMIKAHNIMSIQGNHDQVIAYAEPIKVETLQALDQDQIQQSASRAYTTCVIREDNRRFLKGLPRHMSLSFDNFKLMVVHGSPNNNKAYMYEDSEQLEDLFRQGDADILISGHTHIPYFKALGNSMYVGNAGSVGIPKHGRPNATYLLLEIDQDVKADIIEVAYDFNKVTADIEASPFVHNKLIDIIKSGKVS